MKHTLLPLSLALLPLAVAEPTAASPAATQAEQRAAAFTCMALSRPLPGGGCCTVAGGGEVMRDVSYFRKLLPAEAFGSPAPVPENRVTRALNTPQSAALPADWYDDKYQAFWAADAFIPAEQVPELWYAALERLDVPVSWFCDAAGDNLVIMTGHAANFYAYEMYLYQWNAQKQGFMRRAVYYFSSRYCILIPSRVEFLPEGLLISALSFRDGKLLEFRHPFRHADGNAAVRFPERTPGLLQPL